MLFIIVTRIIKSYRPLAKCFATLFYVMSKISPIAALLGITLYIFTLIGY